MKDTSAVTDPTTVSVISAKKGPASLWIGVVLAAIVSVALFIGAYMYLGGQQANRESDLATLQETIGRARAENLQTWLNGLIETSKRLAGSDIFRLFAAEVNELPEGIPLLFSSPNADLSGKGDNVVQLASQLNLMQNLLSEFIMYNSDFIGARIMTTRGESYLSTSLMRPVTSEQIAFVKETIKRSEIIYGPLINAGPDTLMMDIFFPLYPQQAETKTSAPIAVLVITVNANSKLTETLAPGAYRQQGLKLLLVQKIDNEYQAFIPEIRAFTILSEFPLNARNEYAFGEYPRIEGKGMAYISGFKVPKINWWILPEHDESFVSMPVGQLSHAVYTITALVCLVLALCFVAAWWWLIGRRQNSVNNEFRQLLSVIEDQKKFLDGINNTISDPITLTNEKGIFTYVNKAFAATVGRDEESCIGLDGPAIFGFDTAKRLNVSDQHVLMSGESLNVKEILWLQSKRYYFQISKTPLRDVSSRATKGIVSVYRDITDLVEAEKRSHRVVQQTIDALVSAIEQADPFLGGHSRIMGRVAALIARQLGMTEGDIATIEAAANLSQVGKMFVPRDILLKPGALTSEEKHEMERHVEYTYNALKNIEFDLPVLPAITQMNERPDGKGYPKGLTGDQISIHAKILAVANAFAAMARPRSYRPALPIHDVLSILNKDAGTIFDPDVVAALREVLTTPAGEKIAEFAASTQAV